jgi:hypothetical protein
MDMIDVVDVFYYGLVAVEIVLIVLMLFSSLRIRRKIADIPFKDGEDTAELPDGWKTEILEDLGRIQILNIAIVIVGIATVILKYFHDAA